MNIKKITRLLCQAIALITMAVLLAKPSQAQNGGIQDQAPSVFLDCNTFCFEDYLRTNITFVNYVRDQTDADIHLLINQTQAGSGSQYTLTFIGRQGFSGQSDTLRYSTPQSDTQEERRTWPGKDCSYGTSPLCITNTRSLIS